MHSALGEGSKLALSTLAVGGGRNLGGLGTSGLEDTLEFLADVFDAGSAGAGDGSDITIVRVDADNVSGDAVGLESGDRDGAGSVLLRAVTT